MGTYTTAIGSSGVSLKDQITSLNIQLPANEYPTKIHFELKGGGAYWKQSSYQSGSGEFWLHGDAAGKIGVKFGELTLPKVSSNITLKDFDIPNGKTLLGCPLYFNAKSVNNTWGVALRNRCTITITTEIGSIEPEKPADPDLYKKLLPTVDQNDKMIGRARRSDWKIKVKGVDITSIIKQDLISLEITDNEDSKADDLQIKIADRDGVWLQKWLNETVHKGSRTKGLSFQVWFGNTDHTGKVIQQKAGTFKLDSMNHDGPPSVVKIKCASLDCQGGIRTDKNDKCWENVQLKSIASDIATKGKLKLLYCVTKNPKYERKQQDQETDIAFLIRLCDAAGLSVKISDGKLIIFDRKSFETGKSVQTITFGDGQYTKWSLGTGNGTVTYDFCTVSYTNPKTGKAINGRYETEEYKNEEEEYKKKIKELMDSGKSEEDAKKEAESSLPEHTELKIRNKKVNSAKEADMLAESELNLRNLFERTVTLHVPGNPSLMAGLTMTLKKFGYWSGKYMINTCTHSISSSGYTTKLKLRFIKQ